MPTQMKTTSKTPTMNIQSAMLNPNMSPLYFNG